MKVVVKLALGTVVEIDGIKEEVVEGLKAVLGVQGLGQSPVFTPTIWPAAPADPVPGALPPNVWPPNGTIPWPGTCPWAPGTVIYSTGPNICAAPGCQDHAGYKVVSQNDKTVLEPMSMGAILDTITGQTGIDFGALLGQSAGTTSQGPAVATSGYIQMDTGDFSKETVSIPRALFDHANR